MGFGSIPSLAAIGAGPYSRNRKVRYGFCGGNMDKKTLSERDICTKFITPALNAGGWDIQTQVREEVTFTKGRVIVRGRKLLAPDGY